MTRFDFKCIADWVRPHARVLDMGCAKGDLLFYLRDKKQTQGVGVDIDNTGLTDCMAGGIDVVHCNIGEDLSIFENNSFDYVVLSQTLQNVDCSPKWLLNELLRIAPILIISVPNFAYWRHRWHLLGGHAPRGGALPFQWYDTPNLRYCSIKDFESFCHSLAFKINHCVYLNEDNTVKKCPNLLATLGLYQLSRLPQT